MPGRGRRLKKCRRKTGGRKKGALNKVTVEAKRAASEGSSRLPSPAWTGLTAGQVDHQAELPTRGRSRETVGLARSSSRGQSIGRVRGTTARSAR